MDRALCRGQIMCVVAVRVWLDMCAYMCVYTHTDTYIHTYIHALHYWWRAKNAHGDCESVTLVMCVCVCTHTDTYIHTYVHALEGKECRWWVWECDFDVYVYMCACIHTLIHTYLHYLCFYVHACIIRAYMYNQFIFLDRKEFVWQ
jgi:hypothetical protein